MKESASAHQQRAFGIYGRAHAARNAAAPGEERRFTMKTLYTNGLILTLDEDPEAQYDGIRRINARDWLLGLTDQ